MFRKSTFGLALSLLISVLVVVAPVHAQNDSKKWTVMVYVDADNNLDLAGVNDIVEMQTVGSSSQVDVVVLFDRWYRMCGFNGSAILHIEAARTQLFGEDGQRTTS